MTSESGGEERIQWLLEPPAPGTLHLDIAVGEGTELTPEIRAALDNLISALSHTDVAGYSDTCYPKCLDLADCTNYGCRRLNNCNPLVSSPCVAEVTCYIGPPKP
jgi:hypothetical protein